LGKLFSSNFFYILQSFLHETNGPPYTTIGQITKVEHHHTGLKRLILTDEL